MKKKKIITIILIILWMMASFYLSHQVSKKSSELSGKVMQIILEIFNLDKNQTREQRLAIHAIIRKLAHYSIYTIGGILLLLHVNLYKIKTKNKVLISWGIRNMLCNYR